MRVLAGAENLFCAWLRFPETISDYFCWVNGVSWRFHVNLFDNYQILLATRDSAYMMLAPTNSWQALC